MKTLNEKISRYIWKVTLFWVAVILIFVVYLQITIERRRAYEISMRTFSQIEQVLEENGRELVEIQEQYRRTCLHRAETIARILEGNPDLMYDVRGLKEIARAAEVDEIHLFDSTGRILPEHIPNISGIPLIQGSK